MAERLSEAKARRVYPILRDRIFDNAIAPGARLPTEVTSRATPRLARGGQARARRAVARAADRAPARQRNARHLSAAGETDDRRHRQRAGDAGRDRPAHHQQAPVVRLYPGGRPDRRGARPDRRGSAATVGAASTSDGMPFSHLVAHVPDRVGRTYTRRELAAKPLLALLERSGVVIEERRASDAFPPPWPIRACPAAGYGVGAPLLRSRARGPRHRMDGRCRVHLHASLPARPLQSPHEPRTRSRRKPRHLAGRAARRPHQQVRNPHPGHNRGTEGKRSIKRRQCLADRAVTRRRSRPRPAVRASRRCCARRARP